MASERRGSAGRGEAYKVLNWSGLEMAPTAGVSGLVGWAEWMEGAQWLPLPDGTCGAKDRGGGGTSCLSRLQAGRGVPCKAYRWRSMV